MTPDSPKGPESEVRTEDETPLGPACACSSCVRWRTEREAWEALPLRERVAREISRVDGGASSVEPCGDATYEEMADAALAVVAPEWERLTAEVTQLRADMRIRQGALNDVLGHDRTLDTPTDYYRAVEDVAELRREVSRLREQLAAQTARYNATLHTAEFQVGDIVCWRGDRWFEGRIVCETAEEDRILDTERWDLEVTDPGTMYDGVDMTGRPVHVSQDCLVLVRRPSVTVEAPEPDEFAMTLRPQLQANSKLEQNLEDAVLLAVAQDRVRRDKGERHLLEDVAEELELLDEGRPSGSERLAPRPMDELLRRLRAMVADLQDKGIPEHDEYCNGFGDAQVQTGNDLEALLDEYAPDAALAARSEATQLVEELGSVVEAPSPSLRKEGEDSDDR